MATRKLIVTAFSCFIMFMLGLSSCQIQNMEISAKSSDQQTSSLVSVQQTKASSKNEDSPSINGLKKKVEDLQKQVDQLKQVINTILPGFQNIRIETKDGPAGAGFHVLIATCLPSEKVISGGFRLPDRDQSELAAEWTVYENHIEANSWKLSFAARTGEDGPATVYAICAK